jgi:hypothetical protein
MVAIWAIYNLLKASETTTNGKWTADNDHGGHMGHIQCVSSKSDHFQQASGQQTKTKVAIWAIYNLLKASETTTNGEWTADNDHGGHMGHIQCVPSKSDLC